MYKEINVIDGNECFNFNAINNIIILVTYINPLKIKAYKRIVLKK